MQEIPDVGALRSAGGVQVVVLRDTFRKGEKRSSVSPHKQSMHLCMIWFIKVDFIN